jgi:hypothetical protein
MPDERLTPIGPTTLAKPVNDIKRHVLQLEGMVLFLLGFQVIILFRPLLEPYFDGFSLLVPFGYLALLPLVMRANNPRYTPRSTFKGALSGTGVGGTIGGGVTGTLTGGLGAPAGALVGGAIGAVIGAIVYPWVDGPGTETLLERGEAFDYLYQHRRKNPLVANAQLVDKALDTKISWFDKNADGRRWYAVDDLQRFLNQGTDQPPK